MALINCPECGREVSSAAPACPNCGFPVAAQQPAEPATAPETELLAEVRPSRWGFFWHYVFFFLVVPVVIAWWRRKSIVLRVYPGRLMLERGIFTKCYREFLARDIRSIDIDQNFLARLVGIGDLSISTAATTDASEKIVGIPDPHGVRDLILAQRGSQ